MVRVTKLGVVVALLGILVAIGIALLQSEGKSSTRTASKPTTEATEPLDTSPPSAVGSRTLPPNTTSPTPGLVPEGIGPVVERASPQIGRVEVVPSEFRRIATNTWAASRYGDNKVAFRYGWDVYDSQGNIIDNDVECRVQGIVTSSAGVPMGSRNGYCEYDMGFTKHDYLPPGEYRVTVTAKVDSGSSKQAMFDFTVVADTN